MENIYISEILKDISDLLELHNGNIYKINSLRNASLYVKKLEIPLGNFSENDLKKHPGIGPSIASIISEISIQGLPSLYVKLREDTPTGILHMREINGLGIKKIKQLWLEYNINSIDSLLEACKSGKIASIKGFGKKTEQDLIKKINFLKSYSNKVKYPVGISIANEIINDIKSNFSNIKIEPVGDLRRNLEIINSIDILIEKNSFSELLALINGIEYLKMEDIPSEQNKTTDYFAWHGKFSEKNFPINLFFSSKQNYVKNLITLTGSSSHLNILNSLYQPPVIKTKIIEAKSEKEFYDSLNLQFIPPEMREGLEEINYSQKKAIPHLIQPNDIQGIFHAHSNYSDGIDTLENMALYCKKQGYSYLGISDHSKSAFYANGLDEKRIITQHQEIDILNQKLKPFRIFKGIESDILKNGELDYNNEILKSFDFIIASVHSVLKMDEDIATQRLIKAIENPFTTILGHPTGRLLLKREGYPINHKKVIDACKENNVIIELNSNPNRLDIDWRWIYYMLEKEVLLSINPDAHSKEGYADIEYGIKMARKAGVSKEHVFNAFPIKRVIEYLNL